MPTYTATFLVPAQVFVRVTVDCDNQQTALAAVHDQLQLAKPDSVTVQSLDLEGATMGDFMRAPHGQPAVAPAKSSTTPAPGDHAVYSLLQLDSEGGVLSRTAAGHYLEAKAALDAASADPLSAPARYELRTPDDRVYLSAPAKRGGWEALASPVGGEPAEVHSWLPDKATALKLVRTLLATGRYAQLLVVDFSDRTKGPRTVVTLNAPTPGALS